MPMKTYPMKVEDGKVYAEVTLRDVVERCDVSDLPILAEVKRLYDENAKLQELVEDMLSCIEIRAAFDRPPTEEMYETFAQRARELGVEGDE